MRRRARPQLEQQEITLRYEPPNDTLIVDAHEEQLVGVFLNLFVNAAEAMPSGGDLRVGIDRHPGASGAAHARVIVRDTGRGVAADVRARIFDPFFTTKRDGSGLGLAVALRDAEQHRGLITLIPDDEPGTGAAFAVDLPLVTLGAG